MFILKPICLLSSDSSCSICCSSCGVSVHRNMSSAKRRLERNSPSIFTPLFSQFNLLNMLSNVAMNSLGEMVSPCLTPLLILIFSLSLCRCTVTELSVCLSGFLCTHLLFLVLAIMSILLGFVLNRMPSRNPRKQHTGVCHNTLITQARVPTSTLTFSNTPTEQEQRIHSGVGIACNAWPWMVELGRFHTKLASR